MGCEKASPIGRRLSAGEAWRPQLIEPNYRFRQIWRRSSRPNRLLDWIMHSLLRFSITYFNSLCNMIYCGRLDVHTVQWTCVKFEYVLFCSASFDQTQCLRPVMVASCGESSTELMKNLWSHSFNMIQTFLGAANVTLPSECKAVLDALSPATPHTDASANTATTCKLKRVVEWERSGQERSDVGDENINGDHEVLCSYSIQYRSFFA